MTSRGDRAVALLASTLARLAEERGRLVLALAVAVLVATAALSLGVADKLDPRGAEDPGGEAARAADRLERAGYRDPALVVLAPDAVADSTDDSLAPRVQGLLADEPAVHSIDGLHSTRQLDYVATDSRGHYLTVMLEPTDPRRRQDAAEHVASLLSGVPGVLVGGPALAAAQAHDEVVSDLRTLLAIGLAAVFLLSLLALRGLAAAALPPLAGALAVAASLAVLRTAAELGSISIFALNLTAGIALALAAGYSLLIVARHRSEIATGGPGLAATSRTLASAGGTVALSSLALAAVLAALLVFPQPVLYSIGLGGAVAALSAAVVALTVLPALLTALGTRIGPPSQGPSGRSPGRTALAICVVVLALGAPFYDLGLADLDPSGLPGDRSARQVDDALRAGFDPFRDTPIAIAIAGTDAPAQALTFGERVARLRAVDRVLPPKSPENDLSVIHAFTVTAPTSAASRDTVRAIRELDAPPGTSVEVAGAAARSTDFHNAIADRLPLASSLLSAGRHAGVALPKVTVTMLDNAYRPARVRVQPGTRVTWFNGSERPNTVETAQSGFFELDREKLRRDNRFDLHTIQPGEAESLVFDKPGVYRYHSSLENEMRGTVEVVAPGESR